MLRGQNRQSINIGKSSPESTVLGGRSQQDSTPEHSNNCQSIIDDGHLRSSITACEEIKRQPTAGERQVQQSTGYQESCNLSKEVVKPSIGDILCRQRMSFTCASPMLLDARYQEYMSDRGSNSKSLTEQQSDTKIW